MVDSMDCMEYRVLGNKGQWLTWGPDREGYDNE